MASTLAYGRDGPAMASFATGNAKAPSGVGPSAGMSLWDLDKTSIDGLHTNGCNSFVVYLSFCTPSISEDL